MKRSGFTLVELLVLLGILGVIAAILFPVFARSRENRHHNYCPSNLKQIGLGFKQYIQDHDERYPTSDAPAGTSGTTLSGYAGILQPYLKSTQMFQCPAEATKDDGVKIDYGYNAAIPTIEEKKFKFPAYTILTYELSNPVPGDEAVGVLIAQSSTGRNRHLEGSNYGFVDGHVKWVKSTQTVGGLYSTSKNGSYTFAVN